MAVESELGNRIMSCRKRGDCALAVAHHKGNAITNCAAPACGDPLIYAGTNRRRIVRTIVSERLRDARARACG